MILLFLAGCAGQQSQLSRSLHLDSVKRSPGMATLYVKSGTTLRSEPDRSSKAAGRVSPNTGVKEVSRTDNGWSKVKTADGGREGWIPTSLFSEQPVEVTTVKRKSTPKPTAAQTRERGQESAQPSKVEEASSRPESAPQETPSEESGSVFSPAPASAATAPPKPPGKQPAKKESKEEGAKPDMFDAF